MEIVSIDKGYNKDSVDLKSPKPDYEPAVSALSLRLDVATSPALQRGWFRSVGLGRLRK